jgi:O-antigen chain-terminating methyltransferase
MPDPQPAAPAASIDAILADIAREAEGIAGQSPAKALPPRARLGDQLAPVTGGGGRHARWPDPIPDWAALAGCDDATFIEHAFLLAFGREVDRPSFDDLRDRLARGATSRARLMQDLLAMPEAAGRPVEIRGLSRALLMERLARRPGIGRLFQFAGALVQLPWHLAVVARRLTLIEERQARIARDIDQLVSEANHNTHLQKVAFAAADDELRLLDDEARHLSARADDSETFEDEAAARLKAIETTILAAQRLADAKLEEAKAVHRSTMLQTSALGAIVTEARQLGAARLAATDPAPLASLDDHAHDELYLAFENRFRGAPEEIAERCRRYLPLIAATPGVAEGGAVLDIGCGRGEWLTLLKEAGHACRGVDLNRAMVQTARERGHDVVAGDAIAYLRGLPADSLGAITAFHLVEHLPFPVLMNLLEEANRTLRPGGAILFETPNPECLVVGACNFYYDPTHRNPLPPGLLRFLAEERAFSALRIIRRDEDLDLSRPESGFAPAEVNDWFAVPMDYALYARRA